MRPLDTFLIDSFAPRPTSNATKVDQPAQPAPHPAAAISAAERRRAAQAEATSRATYGAKSQA